MAQLQAVALAGTVVKRASLHNANEIQRLGLHEGDTVQVEKGGEIIPKVTGVVEALREPGAQPIRYIDHCPECGSAWSGRKARLSISVRTAAAARRKF
ncbi:hypothetical protein [Nitritalea halalkaliphila]|uniref:hypothetical protein n=1 Tax=Nitritalea halalkaliphila TaxID=590849 RepID=UPI0029341266|nr:hypothetical protein [Nitritalea halalkaliphila]